MVRKVGRKLFLIGMVLVVSKITGIEWVNPSGCDVRTIYFQGIFSSQAQIAKYTGEDGFIATTGEHVVCKGAPNIIYQPYVGKELDEVDLKHIDSGDGGLERFLYYLKKICFPIASIQEIITGTTSHKWGITVDPVTASKEETVNTFSICWSKCDFGQEKDVAEHKSRYEKCMSEHPDASLILFGTSRGAATTFDAAVLNKYDMTKIKLIILEACFDSIPLILKERNPKSHSSTNKAFQRLLSLFTGYQVDGICPISLVDEFPEGVPVVFISSQVDTTVPFNCTCHLAQEVAKRGKNEVYFLTLKHSSHPKYTLDNDEDKERYIHFIHALYKQLGLPCVLEYAVFGEQKGLLEETRM